MKSSVPVAFLGGWSTFPVDGRRHSIERGDGCGVGWAAGGWNRLIDAGFLTMDSGQSQTSRSLHSAARFDIFYG